MFWMKLAAKVVVLVVPIFLVLAGGFLFLILPHLDRAWAPLVFVAPPLAVLIANAVWPLDGDA